MADSFVVTSALMSCSFGMAPATFTANPARTVMIGGKQKGNIGCQYFSFRYVPIIG